MNLFSYFSSMVKKMFEKNCLRNLMKKVHVFKTYIKIFLKNKKKYKKKSIRPSQKTNN